MSVAVIWGVMIDFMEEYSAFALFIIAGYFVVSIIRAGLRGAGV